METIEVRRRDRDEAHRLVGKGVPSGDWTPNAAAPALVVDVESGEPVMLLDRYSGDLAALRRAMRSYPMNTTVRAVGVRNRSNTFGYSGRRVMMQRNGCRACSGSEVAPEAHAGLLEAGPVMARMLGESLGPRLVADEATARAAILPDWILPGCHWTSGVLNETSPLPYHYDRNNLPTWSAMVVTRRGTRGGHLHVPELGLVVDCRDGDVVMFPGWHFVHGVTPIRKLDRSSYRYSAVLYTVSGMALCKEPEAEMAWARSDRTRRESDLRDATARLGK